VTTGQLSDGATGLEFSHKLKLVVEFRTPRIPPEGGTTYTVEGMRALLPLLIALLAAFDGFIIWSRLCTGLGRAFEIAAGVVTGLALNAWIGFLLALVFGLNGVTITATIVLLSLPLAVTLFRGRIVPDHQVSSVPNVLSLLPWAVLLAWLWSRVVIFEKGDFFTAPENNFGDLPFHLSAITSFAFGDNFPPQNPIFAGIPFTYSFLIDLLTAFYLRAGAGWRVAFFIENFALSLSLVVLIYVFARGITGSALAAALAPLLFFFNGGFGFLNLFKNARGEGLLAHTYTMNTQLSFPYSAPLEIPIKWGNVFTTLIIPQRSLLFGLPVAALILILWWIAATRDDQRLRKHWLVAGGVLAGLLPLLHAHGFLAIMTTSIVVAVFLFPWRHWPFFFIPAIVLALPQVLFLRNTPIRQELFKLHWGWEAGESPVILFWAANAGIFLLLLAIAYAARGMLSTTAKRFTAIFWIWFLIPNVVLLAPWPWDNIKMLVYWLLVMSPVAAQVLARAFQRTIPWKLAASFCLLLVTLSGVLDVLRALSPREKVRLFSRADREVAELIRQTTDPHATVLHAPVHDSAVSLTGRRSVMGYPGHLWTHGIDYEERESDVKQIFKTGSRELLEKYGVDYVLIGPVEKHLLNPDESVFTGTAEPVLDHSNYKLFKVLR
jgi:hypothetical protein